MGRFAVFALALFLLTALALSPAAMGMMGGWMGHGRMMGGGDMCGLSERIPKTGVDPRDLPDAGSADAEIYSKYCSQCHALPSPKSHSVVEWAELVERMDRRMGGGLLGGMMSRARRMSGAEKKAVVGYLKNNALNTLDRSAAAGLDTPGYEKFEEIRSQCHDLPDPAVYKESDWPMILVRMKSNMADAEMAALDPEDERAILGFLRKNSRES